MLTRAVFLLLLASSAPALASTYYAAKTGNDANTILAAGKADLCIMEG